MQARFDKNPDAMRTRRETVEHPFSTLKMRMGCHALLDEDATEGCHRDGVARARLHFNTRTEYLRSQANYGGGQGVMRPDFRVSGWVLSDYDARAGVRLRCRRNRKNIARKPCGASLHCDRGRLRTRFRIFARPRPIAVVGAAPAAFRTAHLYASTRNLTFSRLQLCCRSRIVATPLPGQLGSSIVALM